MTITLKTTATGGDVIFTQSKNTGDKQVFTNIGTSFLDARTLTNSVPVNQRNGSKPRVALKVPYSVPVNGSSAMITKYMYANIEFTVEADAPIADVEKLYYMLQSAAVQAFVLEMVRSRRLTAS